MPRSALRVISKHGGGIDTIDSKAAAARGIAVKAAVGANADAVAEHAWALILACAKKVVALDARMRAGFWDKATHKSLELKGKTLGVVGLGAIGRRVAEMGVALGMRVLAFDPFAKEAPAGRRRSRRSTTCSARAHVRVAQLPAHRGQPAHDQPRDRWRGCATARSS